MKNIDLNLIKLINYQQEKIDGLEEDKEILTKGLEHTTKEYAELFERYKKLKKERAWQGSFFLIRLF